MATSSIAQLRIGQWPVYYREGIDPESTQKASELLQVNHERYHIYFNDKGFHNHIAHHLLTLWSLKASPTDLQRAFDSNSSYQRPVAVPSSTTVTELQDVDNFTRHLGQPNHYNDFLAFFEAEIRRSSWQQVLQKYVFAGDTRADDMLVRLYAGFYHPIIHLGLGIEFHQPAIIAEALAQAATHSNSIGDLFLPAEQAAKKAPAQSKSIVQLLNELHADNDIKQAAHWADDLEFFNKFFSRAAPRVIEYASQVIVKPHELEQKTAEMMNACALFAGGVQRSEKAVKYDFFFMHTVNCSIFFSSFLRQEWLSEEVKVRLLEWKIRLDLALYASETAPTFSLGHIRAYKPKLPSGWDKIQDRVCSFDDDGHASKLVRALAQGEQACKPYENNDAFQVKGGDWLQLAHMAIDSVEMDGDNWIRRAGHDEAWEDVPLRAQL